MTKMIYALAYYFKAELVAPLRRIDNNTLDIFYATPGFYWRYHSHFASNAIWYH